LNAKFVVPLNTRGTFRRKLAVLALALPLAGFGGIERWFAPSKKLWPKWQAVRSKNKTRRGTSQLSRVGIAVPEAVR
jgi:hypothetical protein